MAPNTKMTKEFKKQAEEYILNKSKDLIATKFDKNDKNKGNQQYNENDDINKIIIFRNRFPEDGPTQPYYEDYRVQFETIIQNQKIWADFYLDWKNDDINSELILSNTIWCIKTGKCSKRVMKIHQMNIFSLNDITPQHVKTFKYKYT